MGSEANAIRDEMDQLRMEIEAEIDQRAAGLSSGSLKRDNELKELFQTFLLGEAALRRATVTKITESLERVKEELKETDAKMTRKVIEVEVLDELAPSITASKELIENEIVEALSQAEAANAETTAALESDVFTTTKKILDNLRDTTPSTSTVATEVMSDSGTEEGLSECCLVVLRGRPEPLLRAEQERLRHSDARGAPVSVGIVTCEGRCRSRC